MTREQEIRELIRKIASNNTLGVFTAEVVSVENNTCTIQIHDLKLTGVRLTSVTNKSTNTIVITPSVGSVVSVIDMGGEYRDLVVFQYTEIDKITINNGTLGGLTITPKLVTQLGKLSARLDAVISALKKGTVTAQDGGASYKSTVSAALDLITDKEDFSSIEDTKILH